MIMTTAMIFFSFDERLFFVYEWLFYCDERNLLKSMCCVNHKEHSSRYGDS